MRHILIALFVMCWLLPTESLAQTQAQAAKFSKRLDASRSLLFREHSNLLQIDRGLPPYDDLYINEVFCAARFAENMADRLSDLAFLYALMRNDGDKKLLLHSLDNVASYATKQLDLASKVINLNVARVDSPAAVAEVDRIRGTVQSMRDEMVAFSNLH